MAEIIIREGEEIGEALSRFKLKVARERTLATLKRSQYFLTKSQKKRLKSKVARKRLRRIMRKIRQFEEPEDYKPWTNDTVWPPFDPTKIGPSKIEEEPTAFVCAVIEHTIGDISGVILIKDFDKGRFGFPGGGVASHEQPNEAIVRETFEETGYIVGLPSESDLLFSMKIDRMHSFYCYRTRVIGGEPRLGEEVKRMILKDIDALKEFADMNGLLPNHKTAFLKFIELKQEKQTCTA